MGLGPGTAFVGGKGGEVFEVGSSEISLGMRLSSCHVADGRDGQVSGNRVRVRLTMAREWGGKEIRTVK